MLCFSFYGLTQPKQSRSTRSTNTRKKKEKPYMKSVKDLTPSAQDALRKLRALHRLPQTTGSVVAERKILNTLNSVETLDVALILAAEEADHE
jgi:hypothetical protein